MTDQCSYELYDVNVDRRVMPTHCDSVLAAALPAVDMHNRFSNAIIRNYVVNWRLVVHPSHAFLPGPVLFKCTVSEWSKLDRK